jgi:DNA-binding XRE family transcriptional regulator
MKQPAKNLQLVTAVAASGLSWRELARSAEVGEVTLRNLVTGKSVPTFETASGIASVLNARVHDLFPDICPRNCNSIRRRMRKAAEAENAGVGQ